MPSEILVKNIYIPDCKISLASFVLRIVFTQIWLVTGHEYIGTSKLASQTSFREETSGGVAKCRLFSQAMIK